jgi:hypothetical protein
LKTGSQERGGRKRNPIPAPVLFELEMPATKVLIVLTSQNRDLKVDREIRKNLTQQTSQIYGQALIALHQLQVIAHKRDKRFHRHNRTPYTPITTGRG